MTATITANTGTLLPTRPTCGQAHSNDCHKARDATDHDQSVGLCFTLTTGGRMTASRREVVHQPEPRVSCYDADLERESHGLSNGESEKLQVSKTGDSRFESWVRTSPHPAVSRRSDPLRSRSRTEQAFTH